MDYKGMAEGFGHLYDSLLEACPSDMAETDKRALAYEVAELEQAAGMISESMSLLRKYLRLCAEKPVQSWHGIASENGAISHLCEHAHNVQVHLRAILKTLEQRPEVRDALELDDDST